MEKLKIFCLRFILYFVDGVQFSELMKKPMVSQNYGLMVPEMKTLELFGCTAICTVRTVSYEQFLQET